jgi:type IV secretory pathway ATPase VirB11/archaellum biosynthesis ATPase
MLLLLGSFLSSHPINIPVTPSSKPQVQINQQVIRHSKSRVSNHSNIKGKREEDSRIASRESKGKGMMEIGHA